MPTFRGREFQEPCWEAKILGPGIKIIVRYRDISHSLVCGRKGGSSKVLGIPVATRNNSYPFSISLVWQW